MVRRYRIAAINKGSLKMEALKRFKDRGYSKRVMKNYEPNVKKAKFIKREKGFSIYSIPVVKKKRKK